MESLFSDSGRRIVERVLAGDCDTISAQAP